jgi:hypothetical protein
MEKFILRTVCQNQVWKIMRLTQDFAAGDSLGDISTLLNPEVVQEIIDTRL